MQDLTIVIKGAGEMASGIAYRLFKSNFRKICMTEVPHPQAVRRKVSFCEAVYDNEMMVEDITGVLVESHEKVREEWDKSRIPIIVDSDARVIPIIKPDIVIDAILAKKNVGTKITDAPHVIGVGPGFSVGRDVHLVVETNRGHNMGRVLHTGEAEANTGVPGTIAGYGVERVLRGPKEGILKIIKDLGDSVEKDEIIGWVDDYPVKSEIKGIIRGLLRDKSSIWKGMKIGDIDSRASRESCSTVSDKALAIGGGVLEAMLSHFNR